MGWWSERSSLEKTLTVICSLGALLSIGLLIGLIVVAVQDHDHNICLTSECIKESSSVLKNMNLEADPCDDFYEFACGKFLKETVIPDDKTQVTSFSVIDNKLKEDLRMIIQQPINNTEIAPFQNAKRLYAACLDTETIETRGPNPISPITTNWPVLSPGEWAQGTWTWHGSAIQSKNAGYSASYFFSFSVSTDNRNSIKRVIRIDQASLGLSRQYLIKKLEEPFVQAYHNYRVDLAKLFGATEAKATTEMEEVLNFEIELAEISMASEDRRDADKLYNPYTVAELQAKWNYDGFNWLNHFNALLPAEAQLVATDRVIVGAVSFFDQLGALIAKTPVKTLANYAIWRQVASSITYMPRRFRERQQEYTKATTGREVQDPRWLECVDITLSYYPHAFGALYVRKHFKEEAKEKVLEMVNNIMDEFKIMLDEIEWMDATTKTAAKDKANKMKEQMAYADQLMDDAKITEYYNQWPFSVNSAEYYEAIFGLSKASTERSWKRLREDIDKNEWTSFVTPAIVNAFYSSLENTIKFPAGILQGAFFNAERPKYMNYGGIGFVIGHEITHGFDDQGSQYNGDGNLENWWAQSTRTAYLERARCIINQYGNFTEPTTGLKLNGVNTQGENIADNGGIKESYRAYNRWAKNNPEQQMPGLDFTPQQMFWVSAGQIWCSVLREETMKNRITTGVHSPGQFRVNGPLSNMKEFAEDFNCKAGDKMNPTSRCEVW